MQTTLLITGDEGNKHEIGVDWYAADFNGRGGRVAEINKALDTDEYIITVRTKEGMEILLKGSELSFTYPPEGDDEAA